MRAVLACMAKELKGLGHQYHFLQNRSKNPSYPYFVGEIFPQEGITEDGKKEYTMLLTGFDRSEDFIRLLECAEAVEGYFPTVSGRTFFEGNQCIAAYFSGATPIPSGEEGLQKMEIKLSVKSWKGCEG